MHRQKSCRHESDDLLKVVAAEWFWVVPGSRYKEGELRL